MTKVRTNNFIMLSKDDLPQKRVHGAKENEQTGKAARVVVAASMTHIPLRIRRLPSAAEYLA